jgi:hypothetical protein
VLRSIVDGTPYTAVDVFWPTVEFISGRDGPGAGTQQVLVEDAHGLQWRDLHAGDYVHIPGGNRHAHRNVSDQPAVDLVTFRYENQTTIVPAIRAPETQQAIWFLGALIHIRMGANATGGRLAIVDPLPAGGRNTD